MRLIDLDEFLRQNCVDRMDGKTCEECKHHVLEVGCERLMEQPTAEKVGKWVTEIRTILGAKIPFYACSECGKNSADEYRYCPNCGARMTKGEEGWMT